MKTLKLLLCLTLAILAPRFASALIVAPYTADAHTLHLYHLDAVTLPLLDTGSAATLYNLTNGSATLGAASFTGFTNALSFVANPDQAKTATNSQSAWQGADGAFTYEAVIYVTTALSSQTIQTILSRDHSSGGPNVRSFILRLNNAGANSVGNGIEFINTGAAGNQTLSVALPSTGPNAFALNTWYHIAVTYNGAENTPNNFAFYLTKLDNTVTNANLLATGQLTFDVGEVIGGSPNQGNPFVIGNRDNQTGANSNFRGLIDEVRISDIARATNDMLFKSAFISFVTQPASQSVAINQPVNFNAVANGPGILGYQWYAIAASSTNAIAGATNTTLNITAGPTPGVTNYFLVVTNGGISAPATSSVATLTIVVPPTYQWAGLGADWDFTTANWTTNGNPGTPAVYTSPALVLFDSLGAAQSTVNLTTNFQPTTVTVNTSGGDYSLGGSGTGAMVGTGSLTKNGNGILTLTTTNNFSGGMSINAGTVNLSGTGLPGNGPILNNGSLTANSSGAVNFPGSISGSGTFTVQSGIATLSASNNYTGLTTVSGGTLFVPNANSLGNVSSGTVVNSGAQLYINAPVSIVAEPLTLNGAFDGSGALRKTGGNAATFAGPITLGSDSTIKIDGGGILNLTNASGINGSAVNASLTLSGDGGSAGTVSGPIVLGAGALTVASSSSWTLNGTGNYTGGTTLATGLINFNAPNALGSGDIVNTLSGRIAIGTGLNFTNTFTANVGSAGAATGILMANDNTNGTVTTVSGPVLFNANAFSGGHFAGPTTSGYLNVTGPVTVGGSGSTLQVRLGNVRFSGVHSGYLGVEIRANTTSIGADNTFVTSAVMDIGGNGSPTVPTYFDLNGFNQQLAGLKNTVTPANLGVVTNSGATIKTLTLDPAGNSYSFDGYIAGKVALTLLSGLQVINGTNNYTGNTTVSGGTLELARPTLAAVSTVAVASGAFLQLDFTTTNQVAGLKFNGVSQPLGVYNNTTSPSFITGSGSLLVAVPVATNPTNITAVVNSGKLELSWPADHLGWTLQSQTNSLTTGLGTNWVDVSGSASVLSVTNTINPANGSVFYRMKL